VSRRIRPAAVAGRFYPEVPDVLGAEVDALLDGAAADDVPARAVVAPHAGYVYSGPVAASAYAVLRPRSAELRRVAVLGPAHVVALRGAAVPAAEAWETPLGVVAVDDGLRAIALAAGATVDDGPHELEHAVEVQLPFLQRLCASPPAVLPVAVGESSAMEAARLVGALWDAADAVVVSTDLSHYLDVDAARLADRRTADAVVGRRADLIGPADACGCFALRGLLEHAARIGASVRLLDLRTSADTAGGRERVVGYGAFAAG
jgi:AmmeMemoRadiSam system protein B